MRLFFQGYSDDTFACRGPGIDVDRDNCASGKPITMLVSGETGRMLVIGQYAAGHSGGWQIAVAPYDPDAKDDDSVAIPDWSIVFTPSRRHYSPRLSIETTCDFSVVVLPD